jgi:hypothetical protein
MHPGSTDSVAFQVNVSTDGGTSYAVTKTTTYFVAYHYESDSWSNGLTYDTHNDLAQSTSYQNLCQTVGRWC